MHARLIALVAIALLPAGAAAVTVYRCESAGGTPVFQQQPCDGPGRAIDARPVNSPLASDTAPALTAGAARRGDQPRRHGAPTTDAGSDARGGVSRRHAPRRAAADDSPTVATRDGHGVADRDRPARRPRAATACPGALAIRAERVSASSLTLSPAERAVRERRITEMERCGRQAARR